MQLIGGVLTDGALRRAVGFRPVTGALELELAELTGPTGEASMPEMITRFLASAVETLGGAPATAERIAGLSVGDRQHLTRALGARLGVDDLWLTGVCRTCGEKFDLPIRQSALPVKPAGAAYPAREVTVGDLVLTVRVPTGSDQAAVARAPTDAAAAAALLARLVSGPPGFRVEDLSDNDRARLEAAIEDMAPEVAEEALAPCPDCGAENRVAVDPYLTLSTANPEIFEDVHRIASAYHWGEEAVLALPRDRRKRYLAMIDRQRGMVADPRDLAR